MSLLEAAPAKINLALHVTGRRGDGYHLLDSLVVFAELGDHLVLSHSAPLPQLEIIGPFGPVLRAEAGNLVLDAARAFCDRTGIELGGVSFTLEKNLPVASGIGGGSADCAATLRLLNRTFGLPLSEAELAALGLTLGADVPVCLGSQSCRMSGIGEKITPLAIPPLDLVLINPGVGVSTGAVFTALEGAYTEPMAGEPPRDRAAFTQWLHAQRNDLERPAMAECPSIMAIKEALEATDGCTLARMSGSGATVFGLYDRSDQAQDAAARLKAAYPGWWVEATRTV
mgnify:FL=1